MNAESLASVLGAFVRSIVREELALRGDPDAVYTTRGPVPPGRSLNWLRKNIHKIPGAERCSTAKRGPGVVWTLTHAHYTQWLASRATVTPSSDGPPVSPPVNVDDWISEAGYRPTLKVVR